MTLPAFSKTWQFNVNNSVPAQADTHDHCAAFLIELQDALTGFATNPWVVDYSCDGSTAGTPGDGVDRIDSDLANWIFTTGASSSRSWLVLRNPVTGMELMLSGQGGTNNGDRIRIYVSWAAGFTGGATNSNPSATDEEQIYTGDDNYGIGNLARDFVYHFMHSADGELTYIAASYNNICPLFVYLGVPENPTDGWTNPLVAGWLGDDGTVPDAFATSLFMAVQDEIGFTGGVGRRRANLTGGTIPIHTSFAGTVVGDGSNTPRVYGEDQGSSAYVPGANQISGEYDLARVGLFSFRQTGTNGFHGRMPDLYFSQDTLSDGDTFPGDGTKTRVSLGGYVLPWNGSTPVVA